VRLRLPHDVRSFVPPPSRSTLSTAHAPDNHPHDARSFVPFPADTAGPPQGGRLIVLCDRAHAVGPAEKRATLPLPFPPSSRTRFSAA